MNAPPSAGDGATDTQALAAQVERLLQGDVPPALPAERRLALAWALKQACYAAWSSAPAQAQRCAEVVEGLRGDGTDTQRRELAALAAWTGAIAQLTLGRMDAALQALDAAAEAFVALGQPLHAAQAQVPKLMAWTLLGRHAEAASGGEHLLREFVRLGDRPSAAKVGLNLGNLQMRRDDYRAAARHYREAAVLFARARDTEHSVMADIGVGDALSSLGELDEAQRVYARARMRADHHRLPVLQALVDESVALLDLARGRFREALEGFEAARRRYDQLAMPQHLAIAEKQLGDAYLELRLLPEAAGLLQAALAKMQALDMPDDAAWTLLQLARTRWLQGQTGAARPALAQAATLFAAQDNAVGSAEAALLQAECTPHDGASEEALARAESAGRVFAAQGHVVAGLRADVVAAELLFMRGDIAAARTRLRATLEHARELQLLLIQVQCLDALGRLAQAQGDPREAEQRFGEAVDLFEQQRAALPGDELRSAFLANHLRPYAGLLQLALEAPGGAHPALVLQRLERFRARALGERLLQSVRPVDDPAIRDQRARLGWLYRRAHARGDGGAPSAALADELRRAEQALLEAARRERLLRGTGVADAAPVTRPALAEPGSHAALPDTLQGLLHPGECLVEYGTSGDELFACVVSHDAVRLVRRLASWSAVNQAVRAVRFQLDTLRHGAAPLAAHLDTLERRVKLHLGRLHGMVWAPLAAALDGKHKVLVVPEGALGALPFAALHDGQRYLAEHIELAFAPSAQIACRTLAVTRRPVRHPLVIADTAQLVHAEAEARAVASAFPQATRLSGDSATAAGLRAAAAGADLLHFACHAQFRRDSPMFSALLLADGPLTAESIEGLQIAAGLVVLSACETGLAGEHGGDELVGLVRAFMLAGANRVLASLWPVDDRVSAELMSHLYRNLLADSSASEALQSAQRAVMRAHPHPYFWAAHTVQGGW